MKSKSNNNKSRTATLRAAIVVLTLSSALFSCKKEEIPVYSGSDYLHFTRPATDTLTVSFGVLLDRNEYRLPVPVTRIGTLSNRDMQCALTTDAASTLPATDYEIKSEHLVFRAGRFNDTLHVTLRKTPAMDNERFLLVLSIQPNETFAKGMETHLRMPVYVTSQVERPDWWTDEYANAFLGPYSLVKYQWFIRAIGRHDLSDTPVNEMIPLVKNFVTYLRAKETELGAPIEDENGRLLDTIPYKNV